MKCAHKLLLRGGGASPVAVLMCLLFCIIGFTAGWLVAQRYAQKDSVQRCAPGPWGHVRCLDTFLDVPEELVKVAAVPNEPTRWFVAAISPLNLKLTLRSSGLAEQRVNELLRSSVAVTNDAAGYELRPTDEFIRDLPLGERAGFYKLLASYTQNVAYAEPYRFDAHRQKDWLGDSPLDPEIARLVDKLIYHQNGLWLFSDLNLVLRRYPDKQVYAALFRVMSRASSVLAYLHVDRNDNAKDLAAYWGWPGRVDAVWAQIKAAQAADEVQPIPLSSLLPPFARDRLYRYRCKDDPEFASYHYSAMNFCNEPPDLRFTNEVEVLRSLRDNYVEVREDFQLGDVVQFLEKGKRVVYACNYVADRLVFTKNDGSVMSPWILANLDKLQERYSYPTPVTVRILRRHDLIKH